MKIHSLQSTNFHSTNANKAFKGYINGKYYRDEIIEKARQAMKNSNWEKEMLSKKAKLSDYFEIEDLHPVQRVAAAVVSFGTTELLAAFATIADVLSDNTEKDIEEIKNCIIDIYRSNNKKE